MTSLVQEKFDLECRVSEIETNRMAPPARKQARTRGGSSIEDLRSRFFNNSIGTDVGIGREVISDRESMDRSVQEDIRRRIDSLASDIDALKANGDVSAVKFGGLGFRNVHGCYNWMVANFPNRRYGLIMDPLLMLERICGADEQVGPSWWKTLTTSFGQSRALRTLRRTITRSTIA